MLNAFAKEKEMSERIKELRDRAVVLACLSYEEQTTQTFADNKSFEQLLSEKFAELIIRECITSIRALNNDAPYDEWTSGYTSAIISAAEAVEERFGIKE